MTPEGKVKADIKAWLDARGIWYDMRTSRGFGRKGVPDILICHQGQFVAVECKRDVYARPTPWQEREMEKIRDNGGITVVVFAPGHVETLENAILG